VQLACNETLAYCVLPFPDATLASRIGPTETTIAILSGLLGQDRSYTVLAVAKQAASAVDLVTDTLSIRLRGWTQGGMFYVSLPLSEANDAFARLFPEVETASLSELVVETSRHLGEGLAPTPSQTSSRSAVWSASELSGADRVVIAFAAPSRLSGLVTSIIVTILAAAILNLLSAAAVFALPDSLRWFIILLLVLAAVGVLTTVVALLAGAGWQVGVAGLVTSLGVLSCCGVRLARGKR
jgi:hypothetical protein